MKSKDIYTNVTMAGFGGQGLMFIGKLLAFSAMKSGFHVSWIPSYGPEMRGGTANCTVIISSEAIASPVIAKPESLIIMNNPSMEAFEAKLKSGGLLFTHSNLVTRPAERKDIQLISIPADDIAAEAGERKAANMVMLGAYLGRMELIPENEIATGFKDLFGAKAEKLLELNMKAFRAGKSYAQSLPATPKAEYQIEYCI